MISQASGGSGGARSADTVAQSAAGRRVASTIDFLHTAVREVRNYHVLVFSSRLFPSASIFRRSAKRSRPPMFAYAFTFGYVYVLIICLDRMHRCLSRVIWSRGKRIVFTAPRSSAVVGINNAITSHSQGCGRY